MDSQNCQNKPPPGTPASLRALRVGGTEVHYYVLCPRKLWWFSHGMEQEHVEGSAAAESVALGQLLHKESYPDKAKKDVLIDDLLRLDFTDDGVVHEVKRSKGGQRATLFQLLYYLYYLKREKGIQTTGVIDYPKQRRREQVALTPDLEAEVERVIDGVRRTRDAHAPRRPPADASLQEVFLPGPVLGVTRGGKAVKSYYVLSNGRVKREHNTLYIENEAGEKRPVPIEDVDSLYLYGEVDLNTKLLNFLSQRRVPLHVFNYYGFYAGSYYPREYLHSGFLLVQQVAHYAAPEKRLHLARELVRAAAHSLLRNVSYYARRRDGKDAEPPGEVGLPEPAGGGPSPAVPTDPDAEAAVDAGLAAPSLNLPSPDTGNPLDAGSAEEADPLTSLVDFDGGSGQDSEAAGPDGTHVPLSMLRTVIESLAALVDGQDDVNALRGVEGKMRERYYQAWRHILAGDWAFARRVRRPPDNEVNALISFGNSVLYTACLSELYRTQLTPTVSYLHEPGARRFSLALDLSEIFKPLIVDRAIFRLLNTGQLTPAHFDRSLDGCYLTDAGKRLFLASLEERLRTTIKHRRLGRSVTYRHLIRLECYKLIRHLTGVEPYRAFRAWW